MLKAQLARALQLPMDTRAEQGLVLLSDLDEAGEPAETEAPAGCAAGSAQMPAASAEDAAKRSEDRRCDRIVAMLRARLASR